MSDQDAADILWAYLKLIHRPEKADVIIGLGSADLRTAQHCVKLYEEGWAPYILFAGGKGRLTGSVFTKNEAEHYKDLALKLNVPGSNILVESTSANTGENIQFAYKLLASHNIRHQKIILVTKPYMLRRAYATFIKQWPSNETPAIICSSPSESLKDYCNEEFPFKCVVDIMVGDLQRIREYPKLGFQIEQDIPEEVWQAYNILVERGYTKHLL